MPAHELAICAIFKQEAPYLAEWIAFHRLVGVERFYLYNNDSTDDWKQAIYDSGKVGDVTVIHAPGRRRQMPVYADCLERFGSKVRWIAFIDCDEFLFPTDCSDLRTLLADYVFYPALVANWVMFGSSGRIERTEGLVTQRFQRRGRMGFVAGHPAFLRAPDLDPALSSSYRPMNSHVKSIVQPSRTVGTLSPHIFRHRDGALAVNEKGDPVGDKRSDYVSIERLRINHYWSKSIAEMRAKRARGAASSPKPPSDRFDTAVERLMNQEVDTSVLPLACRLRGWTPMFGAAMGREAAA